LAREIPWQAALEMENGKVVARQRPASVDESFADVPRSTKEQGMRRRDVVKLLAGAAIIAPLHAAAESARTYRLAMLASGPAFPPQNPNVKFLLGVLADKGYKLDQNLEFHSYGADAQLPRLPQVVRDIVASKVDAVVVIGWPPANAMKGTGVPTVVAVGAGDPVATGLVASLAHPGGNITGISDNATMLSTKRLELLKLAVSSTRKVAMLWNKEDLGMTLRYQSSADAAKSLGVSVLPLGVAEPNDFGDAFTTMDREHPDSILMVADALTVLNRKRVYDYANANRLPAFYEYEFFVRDGGLMSYGADFKESFERTASLVDRIFRGAKPTDLPFEEPTRYLFVINLKAAKAIDLDIPANVVGLADEVIE
jgi:putative tryptophan/tyrosine transport system substrate-binding protein